MFKCPGCPTLKPFSSKEGLDSHIVRCHKGVTKGITFKCPECLKVFATADSCRSHRKICMPKPHLDEATSSKASIPSTSSSFTPDIAVSELQDEETPNIEHSKDQPIDEISADDLPTEDESSDDLPDDDKDEALSVEEVLQIKAGAFLAHIRDGLCTTQKVNDEIVKGTDEILEVYLEFVEKKLLEGVGAAEAVTVDDMVSHLRKLKGASLFSGIQNLNDHLIQVGGMVEPVKVPFTGSREVLVNGQLKNVVNEYGYFVPFLKQLERLLQCDQIIHCVDNPVHAEDGVYKTVLNGAFYKYHPVHLKDEKCLAVIAYADGIGLSDSASPRSSKTNLTNLYWTLANIHPELRSLDVCTNLLATAKTCSLTSERWDMLLDDFVEGLKKLASEEGVTFSISGKQRTFHGVLLFFCGDTPAQAYVGGFKESVSAEKPCRRCLASHEDYLSITDVDQFTLRTAETHLQHLAAVESYVAAPGKARRLPNGDHPNPSIRFGVNKRSVLLSVPYFDVTRCLVQDLMHLGPEGLGEFLCRTLIVHVVKVKKAMTLDEVNVKIEFLSTCFTEDRPSFNIIDEHLQKKLRQSAAQMGNLCLILPFVLRTQSEDGEYSFAGDKEYLDCFLEYLKVMNLSMAYEQHSEDCIVLKGKIESLHRMILDLLDVLRMAKCHFYHHLPEQLYLFGVLRQMACNRFEGHHALFKRLMHILRSHKAVLYSLSLRHQTWQIEKMMKPDFLSRSHEFGALKNLPPSVSDPYVSAMNSVTPKITTLAEAKKVTIYGTTYHIEKSVILLDYSGEYPQFGLLKKIYFINNAISGFVCVKLKTVSLDYSLNAFKVQVTPFKVSLDADKLIFPHKILSIRAEQGWYVIPYGHRKFMY